MERRVKQVLVFCVFTIVLVVVAAPGLAAPAGAATSLSLLAPTGDSLRAAPPAVDAHVTVSWTIDAPVSSGYFCVYLWNAASGKAENAWQQGVTKGVTRYSKEVILEPSFFQGDYYILINYRARTGATPLFSARTDGTFRFLAAPPTYHTDVAGPPVPAQILRNVATPVTISFWVVDPLQRTPFSASLVFFQTIGGPQTRFPIPNASTLTIASECGGDPRLLNTRTVTCTLPAGYYMWAIDTLPGGGGAVVDGSYIGTLTVTRR